VNKAASTKKVARAARAGSKVKVRSQRGNIFPVALASVLVLGLALVVWARADRRSNVDTTAPAVGRDHWHAAYGIYVCDKFLDPLPQVEPDLLGIHTHGDGIAHIHPFSSATSGRNATLGAFFDHEKVKITNTELKLPDKKGDWKNGDTCGDPKTGKKGKLQVEVWLNRTDTSPKIYTSNFNQIRFEKDQTLMTIAFVPDGVTPPRPTSEGTLDKLTDVNQTQAPTTGTTVAGATTVPGTATTVANGTTVAGAPTTSASATTVAAASTTKSP
jgi:hypothetical protein